MSNLESERTGKVFQAAAVAWFVVAGVGQAVWDALVNPYVLPAPVFCTGAAVYVWILGRKMRRGAREHHAFMEDHRRRMANFAQRDKAIWS